MIIMECYREMLAALDIPLNESLEKQQERARVWNDWLRPARIPTKDLRLAFIKGNTLREDKRTIGVRDVIAGFREVKNARASKYTTQAATELDEKVRFRIAQQYTTAIRTGKLTLGQLDTQFKATQDWLVIKQTIQTIIAGGDYRRTVYR